MDNDRASKRSSKSNRDSNNMRPEKDHKSRSGSSGDKHHHKSSRPKQQTAQTADRDEAGYESQYSNPGSWNPSGLTDEQHRKKAREREERRQYAIQHPGVAYPKNGHRSSHPGKQLADVEHLTSRGGGYQGQAQQSYYPQQLDIDGDDGNVASSNSYAASSSYYDHRTGTWYRN